MQSRIRVILLTASIGAGHLRAAQILEKTIQEMYSEATTQVVDSLATTAPRLTRWVVGLYLSILRIAPFIYKLLYQWGNNSHSALWFRGLLSYRLAHSTQKQLAAFSPDIVICTHASPLGAVCRLKKIGGLHKPVFAVVTDYTIHRLWIYEEVDRYFVAHQDVKDKLIQQGVCSSRVVVTGIPVDTCFSSRPERAKARTDIGMVEQNPVILMMGGGTGSLPMDEVLDVCERAQLPCQYLVVTGHNESLYRRMASQKYQSSVRIYGYVDNIHELMAASDVLVTKPGGLSSTEALTAGLPMMIYRPIPGQEENNTQFLEKHGVACRVNRLEEVPYFLRELLMNTSRLQQMQAIALRLAKPDASRRIIQDIFVWPKIRENSQ